MNSRGNLASTEHLLISVCATGFQAIYKLLLACMWYRESRQTHLFGGSQALIYSYGTIRPANGRTQMDTRQDGSFVLSQEDPGTLLVHWAYSLAGRKYATVAVEGHGLSVRNLYLHGL